MLTQRSNRICSNGSRSTNSGGGGQLRGSAPLEGTSAYWTEVLTSLALELRFDAFVFWPEAPSREQGERFAHEIVPAVREAVEKEHG